MRNDVRDEFSNAQAIAAVAAVSTNSKKKPAAQDLGIGCGDMGLVVFVDTTAVGPGGYDLEIIEAEDAALTTNVISIAKMNVPADELIAGKFFFLEMPGYRSQKEYFGARFTPTGGAQSVTLSADWGARQDVANYKSFPSTYQIAT